MTGFEVLVRPDRGWGALPTHDGLTLVVGGPADEAAAHHLSSGPARRAIDVAGRDAVGAAIRSALESSVQADSRSHEANVLCYVVASPS